MIRFVDYFMDIGLKINISALSIIGGTDIFFPLCFFFPINLFFCIFLPKKYSKFLYWFVFISLLWFCFIVSMYIFNIFLVETNFVRMLIKSVGYIYIIIAFELVMFITNCILLKKLLTKFQKKLSSNQDLFLFYVDVNKLTIRKNLVKGLLMSILVLFSLFLLYIYFKIFEFYWTSF
jgi:hypothetical protein